MEFLPWRACWRQVARPGCESNCVSPRSSAAPCCCWSLLSRRGRCRHTIVALKAKKRHGSNNRHLSPMKALLGLTTLLKERSFSLAENKRGNLDQTQEQIAVHLAIKAMRYRTDRETWCNRREDRFWYRNKLDQIFFVREALFSTKLI